ncbi:MAG: hypothetical protein JEY96_06970 [Bacteroidales bacterium]|nr:hypothetical protein [Bacteroidales bacterium]
MKTSKFTMITFLVAVILSISLSACTNKINNLEEYLTKMEAQYEDVAFELGNAYWNYYSAEAETDLKTPKKKFYNILVNDTLNNLVDTWYPMRTEIKDTILRRRVEMWHNVLLSAKVEYDAEIMELRGELEEMMEVSGDKDKTNYDFEEKILLLIKLRNAKSVELGFDNYAHLTYETNGIGYEWFLNFVDQMDKLTQESYQKLVNQIKSENKLDEFGQRNAYMFIGQFYGNQDATELKIENNIELVQTSLNNIGIDYATLPAKLVETQLPEGIGGQGLMINIPNDFRSVMTLGMDISVWMHEMGHGLHGLFNSINSAILEGYEWVPGNANPCFAEGMAETSAYFTRNMEWQKKYTNLTEEQIIEKTELTNKYAPAFIRFHLFNFMKETELYLHPEKSYEEIQKDLAKKYLMIETEEMRTRNLDDIIYVTYPLYLQNYLIADMVAIQAHKALFDKFGEDYAFNKEVGTYLINNFYYAGEYFSWEDRMIQGTGKPLDIEAYLEHYKIQ